MNATVMADRHDRVMKESPRGDRIFWWLLAWMIPGFFLPGGFLFLPFGALVFWPLAGIAAALLIYLHRPRGPEVMGILLGPAVWSLAIAYFNRDSVPCPERQFIRLEPGETTFSCGGVAPEPFLIAGVVLVVVALGGAAIWWRIIRRKDGEREPVEVPGPEIP